MQAVLNQRALSSELSLDSLQLIVWRSARVLFVIPPETGSQWQLALQLSGRMALARVAKDVISCSGLMSACEQGATKHSCTADRETFDNKLDTRLHVDE